MPRASRSGSVSRAAAARRAPCSTSLASPSSSESGRRRPSRICSRRRRTSASSASRSRTATMAFCTVKAMRAVKAAMTVVSCLRSASARHHEPAPPHLQPGWLLAQGRAAEEGKQPHVQPARRAVPERGGGADQAQRHGRQRQPLVPAPQINARVLFSSMHQHSAATVWTGAGGPSKSALFHAKVRDCRRAAMDAPVPRQGVGQGEAPLHLRPGHHAGERPVQEERRGQGGQPCHEHGVLGQARLLEPEPARVMAVRHQVLDNGKTACCRRAQLCASLEHGADAVDAGEQQRALDLVDQVVVEAGQGRRRHVVHLRRSGHR